MKIGVCTDNDDLGKEFVAYWKRFKIMGTLEAEIYKTKYLKGESKNGKK